MFGVQGALDAPVADKDAEAGNSTSVSAAEAPANGGDGDKSDKKGAPAEKHHALLLRLLADELGAEPADIVDFELNVCDTHAGVIGGAR